MDAMLSVMQTAAYYDNALQEALDECRKRVMLELDHSAAFHLTPIMGLGTSYLMGNTTGKIYKLTEHFAMSLFSHPMTAD